jgi:hypothetical protein
MMKKHENTLLDWIHFVFGIVVCYLILGAFEMLK